LTRYIEKNGLWVPERRGLGDLVASWTKRMGIRECGGCSRRRAALNRMVPFKGARPISGGLGIGGQYYNSSEAGCDGSDPNILFCDDFQRDEAGAANPTWFVAGGIAVGNKGWVSYNGTPTVPRAVACGAGMSPFGNCAADMGRHIGGTSSSNYTCGATSVLNIDSTADLPSASGGVPPTPGVDTNSPYRIGDANNDAFAITWTGKTPTSLTGVTVGRQFGGTCSATLVAPVYIGQEGAVNIAEHGFAPAAGNVTEAFLRFYYKTNPGYIYGAEKFITWNPGNPGDGGIFFGDLGFNIAGLPTIFGSLGWYDAGSAGNSTGGQNISPFTMQRGNWHFIELHIKLGTGSNGIVEWWINDCGVSGLTCGAAPILRARYTNVLVNFSNGSFLTRLWFEGWANFSSIGNAYLAQVRASKVGPIGFVGTVQPPPPPPAIVAARGLGAGVGFAGQVLSGGR
jgi:hypothetical protein